MRPQRRAFDCGVSCLAAICHVDYADAFYVAAQVAGTKIRDGLSVAQMERIAARFQMPLARVHWRRVDLDQDEGILGIKWNDKPRWADGHWVLLSRGRIFEPDPLEIRMWDAERYLKRQKARPVTLLVERADAHETDDHRESLPRSRRGR